MNDNKHTCHVFHFDLYGTREEKYAYLNCHNINEVEWKELMPVEPRFYFVPKDFELQEEYEKGVKVDELMNVYVSGIKTQRDDASIFVTESDRNKMKEDFLNLSVEEIKSKYDFKDGRDWQVASAKKDIQSNPLLADKLFYRIFDNRYMLYTGHTKGIQGYPRLDKMQHLINKKNISLIVCKQQSTFDFQHVFCSNLISEINSISLQSKEISYIFPIYLYKENMGKEELRIANFKKELYDKIAKGLNYLPCYDDDIQVDPTSEYNGVLYPQDLFDYIYAVLHSPSYRERYKEFLKIDFPRIPCPTHVEQYRRLVKQGATLRKLHLMEDLPSHTGITFPVAGSMQVDCLNWKDNRVYINAEQYFDGVPDTAWHFYIGGYQPAQKWLKDRKGMTLTFEDVKHYGRIIYVLQETERIMQEIDNPQWIWQKDT